MKAKTARKLLITCSICSCILVCISVYGHLSGEFKLAFYGMIISYFLISCSIDIMSDIVKASSGLTIWEHLGKLIDRNERNV